MQNFPNYIRLEGEQMFNILEELKELKFKKQEYFCPMLFDIHFFFHLHLCLYWKKSLGDNLTLWNVPNPKM